MKNIKIAILLLLCIGNSLLYAQTDSLSKISFLNTEVQLLLGTTVSFARGEYIDYQRSFHNIQEANAEIDAEISPIIFGTIGLNTVSYPFDEGPLRNLSIGAGVQYYQKGFRNQFKSTYTPNSGLTDVTEYEETYITNSLSIPIQLYWGRRWYVSAGMFWDANLNGRKTQKVNREQSGSNALNGGFSNDVKNKSELDETLFNNANTGFLLGAGCKFSKNTKAHVQVNFSGDFFKDYPENFTTTICQLSFLHTIKN